MKIFLLIVAVVLISIILIFLYLGKASQTDNAIGLIDDRLAECSSKPNCVCSEYKEDVEHYIEAINILEQSDVNNLSILKAIIQETGGHIEVETDDYLAATFTSNFFKFVDDLEIRIDSDNNFIHIRSASRVGYSDAGINKERVKLIKKSYKEKRDEINS